ncbi:MAG: hypothetical protein A2W98_01150 [Bacteroidetes bacterium GWF2_33_38]|nr:MAG: hypothetical protein A2W98_01150 [Bacteroidetes bacterium GWF2_33_38]OFY91560.1 MAG: hypothetical protein A2236_10625 [Bacteroidetes bacterium RIFOXYA2_FULL_33_7]HBX50599.1 GNAT family N-acetyltransferase [Bacteroidales bacterium]
MNNNNYTQCLNLFSIKNKDIYFLENYMRIYESDNENKMNFYFFEQQNNIALYPFFKNMIPEIYNNYNQNFYDIQSAYGYCGILTNSYEPSFINDFYKSFEKYCIQNNIIAEFTRFNPLLQNHQFSKNHLTVIFDRETVALELNQSYDNIWLNEYSSKNRNMIRKAQKLGFSSKIISNPSKEDIDKFISIYYHSMEKVGAEKYYFFDNNYFYNIFGDLKENSYLFFIIDNENQVVCSSIFFHYGDYFHYHLSGRSEKADNSVNSFLLDEAVKFAKSKGAITFHFGGGRTADSDDSLLKFKTSFSKTRLSFYIGKKIHNTEVYTNIVKQWEKLFPEKIEKFKNHILKYRY